VRFYDNVCRNSIKCRLIDKREKGYGQTALSSCSATSVRSTRVLEYTSPQFFSQRSLNRILVLALLASTQFHGVDRSVGSKTNNNEVPQQQNGSDSKSTAGCAIEMLSDTEGVDFNSYLRDVYLSVKKNWFANMPPSHERGQQGINKVELRVLQDGSVPKDSLKMVQSSEKSDFDTASLQSVRGATPFHHLPESFSKPYIVLRFTFYYNLRPSGNPH
jgi:TonB family protein